MPISSAIKGLQNIKSMRSVVKSGIPNNEESNFIKMYVFEKEKNRLETEEINIEQRLKVIQNRMKEIQVYINEEANKIGSNEKQKANKKGKGKSDFETMSIDY